MPSIPCTPMPCVAMSPAARASSDCSDAPDQQRGESPQPAAGRAPPRTSSIYLIGRVGLVVAVVAAVALLGVGLGWSGGLVAQTLAVDELVPFRTIVVRRGCLGELTDVRALVVLAAAVLPPAAVGGRLALAESVLALGAVGLHGGRLVAHALLALAVALGALRVLGRRDRLGALLAVEVVALNTPVLRRDSDASRDGLVAGLAVHRVALGALRKGLGRDDARAGLAVHVVVALGALVLHRRLGGGRDVLGALLALAGVVALGALASGLDGRVVDALLVGLIVALRALVVDRALHSDGDVLVALERLVLAVALVVTLGALPMLLDVVSLGALLALSVVALGTLVGGWLGLLGVASHLLVLARALSVALRALVLVGVGSEAGALLAVHGVALGTRVDHLGVVAVGVLLAGVAPLAALLALGVALGA
mmetsp:Transcript_24906/g.61605  ORF Transcript_24906/g.61605 Transcript_24906/m.61605 type:complete len:425 (-) Transcript_24906:339-1613(-)